MGVVKVIHHTADNPWEDSPFRKPRIVFGGPSKPVLKLTDQVDNSADFVSDVSEPPPQVK